MDWQPIETAPKDGRRIMLWRGWEMMAGCAPSLRENVAPVIAKWDFASRRWRYAAATSSGDGEDNEFTHWIALPAPPASADTHPQGQDPAEGLGS